MKQLAMLDLAETAITDQGLEKLQSMKQLRKLYLSGSAVTGLLRSNASIIVVPT
jgi:hypothetical protein